jgi:Caspase domain
MVLVIGNAAYQGANPLADPVNDARAIAAKLKALNFEVISVENGGRPPMTIAFSSVRSRAACRCRTKPISSW